MTFDCTEQLGGTAELDFYLLTETSNWPVVLTDQTSADIVFTSEPVSVAATIDEDSIKASATQRTKAEGSLWRISLKLSFITRSEALEQLLDQYQNKPGVVKLKLNNGFQKIFGSNTKPLYMNFTVDEGESMDDKKAATKVTIKGITSQRPVYYTVI